MEFFIKKNASLPILSFLVVKDGRSDYHRFVENLSGSTVTFSMFNFDTGVAKVTSKTAKIITPNPENPSEVYISIQLTSKNTNKVGRYEAQVSIKNDKGQFIFPLDEKIFINVVDSFVFNTECCPPADSYSPFNPVTTTTTQIPITTTSTTEIPITTTTTTIEQILIDPIITENSEYIIVGDNLYLMFVDTPEIPINPIIVGVDEYIKVGDQEYLQYND